VEILRISLREFTLSDLAEWEPAVNITDVTLHWWENGPSIGEVFGEVLQMIKRWRQVRRLTLGKYRNTSVPSLEVLSDFITEMKQLSYLHIFHGYDRSNFDELEILRDKVHELILPRRPNLTFEISHY
jgi:hypothetical protein